MRPSSIGSRCYAAGIDPRLQVPGITRSETAVEPNVCSMHAFAAEQQLPKKATAAKAAHGFHISRLHGGVSSTLCHEMTTSSATVCEFKARGRSARRQFDRAIMSPHPPDTVAVALLRPTPTEAAGSQSLAAFHHTQQSVWVPIMLRRFLRLSAVIPTAACMCTIVRERTRKACRLLRVQTCRSGSHPCELNFQRRLHSPIERTWQ